MIFTVFTPTYNRAHTLPATYESLCRQTFRDFEWLIVDDGSSDNTEQLVQEWIQANIITIRYYKQINVTTHLPTKRELKLLIAKQNVFARNIPADIQFLILLSYPFGLAKYLRQSVSNFGDS
jgi:glycosyltransferase involved in cell wall biosynthesis